VKERNLQLYEISSALGLPPHLLLTKSLAFVDNAAPGTAGKAHKAFTWAGKQRDRGVATRSRRP
jgi:hypothetical protein